MSPETLGVKVREIIPSAVFGEDGDGQLVIYTNLFIDDDEVREFDEGEPAH